MVRKIGPALAGLTIFGTVFYLLFKILPGIDKIEIDMQLDHRDQIQVFYSLSQDFREGMATAPLTFHGPRSQARIILTGTFASFLRLDIGSLPGTATIYRIKVTSLFHSPVVLGPAEISRRFNPGPDTSMRVFADYVEVVAKGSDPYLTSTSPLYPPMLWQAGMVALVCALLAGVILYKQEDQAAGGHTPVVSGLNAGLPGRLDALDGLRGVAAVMVIADHTWGVFRGAGASGVWIFFALSGFLLARPFVDNPGAILSLSSMSGYFRRRFMRIIPMYYAYIFTVFVLTGRFSLAVMHGLFLEGDGHLWAIPQEVLFYLLWPCVVLLVVLPLKNFPKLTMATLLLLMAGWNHFMGREVIWLMGMDYQRLRLYFGVFLAGAFFSFVYSSWTSSGWRDSRFTAMARSVASPLGFAIILFFILFSSGEIFNQKTVYSHKYFELYGILAGLLPVCILFARGRLLDKVLSLPPLRELGTIGLSLYLVHPLVKNIINGTTQLYFGFQLKNMALFLATLACSYLLARYTFRHIEHSGISGKQST